MSYNELLAAKRSQRPKTMSATTFIGDDLAAMEKEMNPAYIPGEKPAKLFRMTRPTSMDRPRKLFGACWAENEIASLFAEDGAGKTILGTMIGCSIATGQSINGFDNEAKPQVVLLFDAELSDFQFNSRYPAGLPDNFKRLTFNEETQAALAGATVEYVLQQIEDAANEYNSRVIILDNLSALMSMADLTKTNDAIQLMGMLNNLKKKGYSILIIDHCRKPMHSGNDFKSISKYDLQGSKMKTNLVDSVFSIGKSCQGENYRYIKALKIRSYQMEFTSKEVAVMELRTSPLRLEYVGRNFEWEHVNDRSAQAQKMSHEGNTQAEIAERLEISQQAVSKILKKEDVPF